MQNDYKTKAFPQIRSSSRPLPETFSPRSASLAVCGFHTPNFQELADLTVPGKQAYCERHGYAGSFRLYDDPSPFHKIEMIRELIAVYDAVLYIDCDAVIMNPSFPAAALIDKSDGQKVLTITRDGIEGVNSGVFMVERCPEAIELLDWMLQQDTIAEAMKDDWKEQRLLDNFVRMYPDLCRVLPQRVMNSALRSEHAVYLYPWGDYEQGDWILHFGGMPYERRVELARTWIPRASNDDMRRGIEALRVDLKGGSRTWVDIESRLASIVNGTAHETQMDYSLDS